MVWIKDYNGATERCSIVAGSRTGYRARCLPKNPRNMNTISWCCDQVAIATDDNRCGLDACQGSQYCKDMVANYCRGDPNTRMELPICQKVANFTFTDQEKANFCSDPANIRKDVCQQFCDTQFENSSSANRSNQNNSFFGICYGSAVKYCKQHPTADECKCINVPNTQEYKDLLATLPAGAGSALGSCECYTNECNSGTSFSNRYRHKNFTTGSNQSLLGCPSCIQPIYIQNSNNLTINKLKEACHLSNSLATSEEVDSTIRDQQSINDELLAETDARIADLRRELAENSLQRDSPVAAKSTNIIFIFVIIFLVVLLIVTLMLFINSGSNSNNSNA